MFDASARKYTLDIDITWNEPMYPNGVITFYEVNVTQTDDSSTVVYSNDGLPVPNVTESVMVLPFTDYTVTVAASTSAGQGDPDSVIVLSPEASKRSFEAVNYVFLLVVFQVQVQWKVLKLCLLRKDQSLITVLECTLWR